MAKELYVLINISYSFLFSAFCILTQKFNARTIAELPIRIIVVTVSASCIQSDYISDAIRFGTLNINISFSFSLSHSFHSIFQIRTRRFFILFLDFKVDHVIAINSKPNCSIYSGNFHFITFFFTILNNGIIIVSVQVIFN